MQSDSTRPAAAGRAARATFVVAAATSALLLSPAPVNAAEYSVTPEVVFQGSISDNRAFTRKGSSSTFNGKTAGNATFRSRFKVATERTELSLAPYFRFRRFSSNPGANSDDQGLVGNLTRTGERSRFEMPFSVLRDSTSSNEFIIDDTEQQTTRSVDVRRLQLNIAPTLSWAATERLTLSVAPSVNDTRFSGGGTLFDFRSLALQGVGSYLVSERTSLLGALSLSYIESPDSPSDPTSTTVGATVGAEHQLSPTLTISGTAGILSTDRERLRGGQRESDSDAGPQGRLSLTRTLERGAISASLSRSRSPTITGTLVENDRASATLRHSISERLVATGTASYNRRSAVGFASDNASQNVDQLNLGLTLFYRLTDRMDLSAAYTYAVQDDRADNERAERNTLFLTFRVGGPTYATSR